MSFHGAYIYGMLEQWELMKTVEFASAVAAIKCTRLGGRTGIPDLANRSLRFLRDTEFPLLSDGWAGRGPPMSKERTIDVGKKVRYDRIVNPGTGKNGDDPPGPWCHPGPRGRHRGPP